MKLHRVPYVPKMWCGPTAIASILGITYDEADALLRKTRKQKRRIVGSKPREMMRVLANSMRQRGINPVAYYIEITVDEQRRPKIRELAELNRIVKAHARYGWVPVGLLSGKTTKGHDHVMAYDHKRKLLCDTNTRGRKFPVNAHPLKHDYLHGIIVVGKEFYNG